MRKNLYAFTASGPMPPFLSVNQEADGSVSLTVRSPPVAVGAEHRYGDVGHIVLPNREAVAGLIAALERAMEATAES